MSFATVRFTDLQQGRGSLQTFSPFMEKYHRDHNMFEAIDGLICIAFWEWKLKQ